MQFNGSTAETEFGTYSIRKDYLDFYECWLRSIENPRTPILIADNLLNAEAAEMCCFQDYKKRKIPFSVGQTVLWKNQRCLIIELYDDYAIILSLFGIYTPMFYEVPYKLLIYYTPDLRNWVESTEGPNPFDSTKVRVTKYVESLKPVIK